MEPASGNVLGFPELSDSPSSSHRTRFPRRISLHKITRLDRELKSWMEKELEDITKKTTTNMEEVERFSRPSSSQVLHDGHEIQQKTLAATFSFVVCLIRDPLPLACLIPLQITRRMKERLLSLGYSLEKVDSMSRDEITRILALGQRNEVPVLPQTVDVRGIANSTPEVSVVRGKRGDDSKDL